MSVTKPHFETEYKQGPKAGYVDWVAGGNFDGYITQQSISFIEHNNQVLVQTRIIDQSRYDGYAEESETFGSFSDTDKDTITVKYGQLEMRGKILGENKEFIVFSVSHSSGNETWNEVFKSES